MKILFLSANPESTARLKLDDEIRKIEDSLQRSRHREQFQLVSKWAVTASALRRSLLDEEPDIVHFSGHGTGVEGLVLEGENGQARPAPSDALAELFKIVNETKRVYCVLLNACYAEEQAKAIYQYVDNVIGMRREVKDEAAIAFAAGFYDGLGYGKSVGVAFKLGCVAIQFDLARFSNTTRQLIPVDLEKFEALSDHMVPILYSREPVRSDNTDSIASDSVQVGSLSEELRTTQDVNRPEAVRQYRERVENFLSDGKLTPIEKIQLATLANVLGISEEKANEVLEEVLTPLLNQLYERAQQHHQSQRWQRVLDIFRDLEAFDTAYPDPEGLKTSARRQLAAQERRQLERKLADLYDQANDCMQRGEWQDSLEKLTSIQYIQQGYQETEILIERVQRAILADQNIWSSIGLIVGGWTIGGFVGAQPSSSLGFSVSTLAGWLGGFVSGVAVPLLSLQIDSVSSKQLLQLLGAGVAGAIVGGLLWLTMNEMTSSTGLAKNYMVLILVIFSTILSIGALLVWRNWLHSSRS